MSVILLDLRNDHSTHLKIVGAGQTGLILAARFQQMNMPTLVVESHARVGDNWRVRYPTLTLHSPRSQFQRQSLISVLSPGIKY